MYGDPEKLVREGTLHEPLYLTEGPASFRISETFASKQTRTAADK